MSVQEILKAICEGLVYNPEKIKIERRVDEMGVLYQVKCDANDRKFLIGKNGGTFRLLNAIIRKIGKKNKEHSSVKIVDELEEIEEKE